MAFSQKSILYFGEENIIRDDIVSSYYQLDGSLGFNALNGTSQNGNITANANREICQY
jgi:hypothetical protein